jgi:mRNA interferase MazF
VAALTRTIRDIPVEVRLGPEDGLPEECVVNADNILTIPKASLGGRITPLSPEKMAQVALAVKFALDLE